MRNKILMAMAILSLLLMIGCSRASDSPITPQSQNEPLPIAVDTGSNDLNLLYEGTFDIDIESMTITQHENRQSDYIYNITGLMASSCPGGCFRFRIVNIVGTVLEIELTIENPVKLEVYDVRVQYMNLYGKKVLNPDSYTDFLGTPIYKPSPFTAFAKSIPNRAFPTGPGSILTETLFLDFPPGSQTSVSYAVTASYPGNCLEPYEINGMNQVGNLTPSGGLAKISANVLDHQNNVSSVYLNAIPFTGGPVQMLPQGGGLYSVDISNTSGAGVGTYNQLIMATSSNPQNISTYNFVKITVTEDAQTSYWTQFQHDKFHAGRTNVRGPQTKHVEWIYDGPGSNAMNVIEGSDGTIYYGTVSNSGRIEAVNPDGSTKWTYFPSIGGQHNKPLGLSSDGTVLYAGLETGAFDGRVAGINASNGSELWLTPTKYDVSSNTYGLILDNGNLVVSGSDSSGDNTACFNKSGNILWRTPADWNWCTAPAQGQNGIIYVKKYVATLQGLNPDTGAVVYNIEFYETALNTQQCLAVRSDNSVVFAGNLGDPTQTKLWCFSATLARQWDLICGPGIPIDGFAIGPNDEIYFTVFDVSYDHTLYAVKPDGSGLLWTYKGVKQWTSPVVDSEGTIYCGTLMGIAAINADGTEKWNYVGPAYAGSPALAHDGSLYANLGGDLYKFADL